MIKSLKRMRILALSSVLALHAAFGLPSFARAEVLGDWNATAASVGSDSRVNQPALSAVYNAKYKASAPSTLVSQSR